MGTFFIFNIVCRYSLGNKISEKVHVCCYPASRMFIFQRFPKTTLFHFDERKVLKKNRDKKSYKGTLLEREARASPSVPRNEIFILYKNTISSHTKQ